MTRHRERIYGADGLPAAKTKDGATEPWLWDGIALAARGDETFVNEPHVSGGSPVMASGAGGERFLVADHLGTTLATLDAATPDSADAVLLASLGTGTASGSDMATDASVRFTGKPFDADLDAFVFPYRNFNPETGAWLSADPAGFPDGPNQHFYAPVPTTGLDPLGLEMIEIVMTRLITWQAAVDYPSVTSSGYSFHPGASATIEKISDDPGSAYDVGLELSPYAQTNQGSTGLSGEVAVDPMEIRSEISTDKSAPQGFVIEEYKDGSASILSSSIYAGPMQVDDNPVRVVWQIEAEYKYTIVGTAE